MKVDVRLPGKGNSNSHGARPVHQIFSMIKRVRTSRLSIKNSLSLCVGVHLRVRRRSLGRSPAWGLGSVNRRRDAARAKSSRTHEDDFFLHVHGGGGKGDWYFIAETPAPAPHLGEFRRMCCPTHCASYCAPCQPLVRAFSGWIRSSPPTSRDHC